ncbi:MAG: primosomal protein DnaI [Buchnera aphidicola (Pentalonia nigronervosa)]|uniref:Replication restart protein DnaT n=1 Tax=Buchnera aphidicola (Pentalonia nigronervosa) TaxID=1309793 RepID=A0A7H1AZ74_9GAMM|nr:MAG: primosomal protein DnaI [Buchnera aphidicola (Pentalonia nigronervosa)]
MKIALSKNVKLELFCKKPIQIIESSKNGIISISKNNVLVFYAITPNCFKNLFDIEDNFQYQKIKKNKIAKKFSMYTEWKPDTNFLQQAALWGIMLTEEISKFELACFISYWKAEGCFFYHVQWQQKLARSLEKSRSLSLKTKKTRDITKIPTPDQNIPDGFRGK